MLRMNLSGRDHLLKISYSLFLLSAIHSWMSPNGQRLLQKSFPKRMPPTPMSHIARTFSVPGLYNAPRVNAK